MWRRTYLFLILVRLYFALSPSYLHPDENFQGPEVIAGRVYSYPVHLTWEFTSDNPLRSSFPLWLIYGLPMYILRWIWEGLGKDEAPPYVVFWTLRVLMFVLSFVLEDWAIQELIQSPHQRRVSILLVASSYVTWVMQTHTFSNSIETLAVLWCLVLVGRILDDKKHSGSFASAVLSFLFVLGVFNRITFPAFVLIPCLKLLPHFWRKPLSLLAMILFGAFTASIAITLDTAFYTSEPLTWTTLLLNPVITPINNLKYNLYTVNLSNHGLHPFYQHVVANLPQLLGPAFPLLLFSYRKTLRLASAASGILILSAFPHQEARFLLPAVPLILSSIRWPKRPMRVWIAAWIIFNSFFGILMGIYHQGGVVPAQMFIAQEQRNKVSHVFWWKTYSPPIWLLNGKNLNCRTKDLMGMSGDNMVEELLQVARCDQPGWTDMLKQPVGDVYLVAPWSATFLDQFHDLGNPSTIRLEKVWMSRNHLNLDDLDFAEDGVWATLSRVIGRRGLVIWKVKKECGGKTSQ
ncbi:glycosyltransferase family 22 protein [Patellaria atrata CBS 101060]|uniref:Mannosyltransferase n=1 Tax=Patellaria atrata CBS 101060 TaxID=1346257 RepID=A0A9P4SGT1_9PEZI|nr:glycosyltransferase family 22 protein [Patellaria atrata CBS 101060]